MSKPTTIQEYIKWARKELNSDFKDPRTEDIYNLALGGALTEITNHAFLDDYGSLVSEWAANYAQRKKSALFMGETKFEPQIKPYASAVNKSFRINVLWNANYPKPPEDGWVTSDNLFKYFDDAIRGTMVCKYLDGPGFLVRKLLQLARSNGVRSYQRLQAKDEGYYAYHFYTEYEIDSYDWRPRLEIKVTSQLQEVMRDLTDKFYEERRIMPERKVSNWKWNYKENEFKASYLSHALHLLEAYVIQSRDDKS